MLVILTGLGAASSVFLPRRCKAEDSSADKHAYRLRVPVILTGSGAAGDGLLYGICLLSLCPPSEGGLRLTTSLVVGITWAMAR